MVAKLKRINKKNIEIIVVNIIWCLLVITLVAPRYDNSDDHLIDVFLFGGKGESSPNVIFINILLSKVLFFLVNNFPVINWLSLLELILVCVFFITVSGVVLKKTESRICAYMFVMLVSTYVYTLITFSIASILGGMAGLILIIVEFNKDHLRPVRIILGGIFLIISMLLRDMAITATVPFLLVPMIDALFKKIKCKKCFIKELIKWSVLFIGIFSTFMFFKEINKQYYNKWEIEYQKFNKIRGSLTDRSLLDWEVVKQDMESIHITENDYKLLKEKIFDDYEFFDTQLLEKVVEIQTKHKVKREIIFCDRVYSVIYSIVELRNRGIFVMAIIITWLLVLLYPKVKFVLRVSGIWGIFMLYDIYLTCFVERFPRYVQDGLSVIVVGMLLYELCNDCNRLFMLKVKKNVSCVLVFLLLLTQLNFDFLYKIRTQEKFKEETYYNFFSQISQREDEIYYADLIDFYSEIYMRAFSVLEPIKKGIYSNYVRMSIWDREHPITNNQLQSRGMKSPFQDLLDENVYFMSEYYGHFELIRRYHEEHMGIYSNYSMVEYFPDSNIKIFKFQKPIDVYDEVEGKVKLRRLEPLEEDANWLSLEFDLWKGDMDVNNIYIEIVNKSSEETNTYMCVRDISRKVTGSYKAFCIFPAMDLSYGQQYEVKVILENQEGIKKVVSEKFELSY